MEDWLATFGTFQSNLPEGLGAGNYFLPTNRKSLVVSHRPPSLVALPPSEYLICLTGIYSLCWNFLWCAFRIPNGRHGWP